MILELFVVAGCAVASALIMRRQDRRVQHKPRALYLPDPDSPHQRGECGCDTVLPLPYCGVEELPGLNPLPLGGFGRCRGRAGGGCGKTWGECGLRRREDAVPCCRTCWHSDRPEPTRAPGPGVPRSG